MELKLLTVDEVCNLLEVEEIYDYERVEKVLKAQVMFTANQIIGYLKEVKSEYSDGIAWHCIRDKYWNELVNIGESVESKESMEG